MGGTRAGGLLTAKTNKELYGEDWYQRIGAIGGKKGTKDGAIKGFASMRANGQTQKIREAGRRGGTISRRGPVKIQVKEPFYSGPMVSKKVVVRVAHGASFLSRLFRKVK